jgi:hypothetical protein
MQRIDNTLQIQVEDKKINIPDKKDAVKLLDK